MIMIIILSYSNNSNVRILKKKSEFWKDIQQKQKLTSAL